MSALSETVLVLGQIFEDWLVSDTVVANETSVKGEGGGARSRNCPAYQGLRMSDKKTEFAWPCRRFCFQTEQSGRNPGEKVPGRSRGG